jgi:hypothetical protein
VWAQGRPVACLAWRSAPRHLSSRDRYIGWSAEERRRNLRFLAYNRRLRPGFWILAGLTDDERMLANDPHQRERREQMPRP